MAAEEEELRRRRILLTPSGVALMALKYLTLELGGGLAQTLMPVGNVLTIDVVTDTPTASPPGGRGVVFKVSGGVVTIYVWDGTQWLVA